MTDVLKYLNHFQGWMLSGHGASSCDDRCTVMKLDLKWKPLQLPQDLIQGTMARCYSICVCVRECESVCEKCMTMPDMSWGNSKITYWWIGCGERKNKNISKHFIWLTEYIPSAVSITGECSCQWGAWLLPRGTGATIQTCFLPCRRMWTPEFHHETFKCFVHFNDFRIVMMTLTQWNNTCGIIQ